MTKEEVKSEETTVNELTAKEIAVMKMRHFGASGGKGGFRRSAQGSNRGSRRRTSADQKRADAYYQEHIDIFYEYTVEQLEEMISEDKSKAYFRVELTDGSSAVTAKRITGSALGAFQDALQFKMREKAMEVAKKAEEDAKLKEEADAKEVEEKDRNLKIKSPKAKKKASPKKEK